MLCVENYIASYGYANVLVSTYNICCISISSSSLVVCTPSTRSCRRGLLVLYRNRWVSLDSRRSASIFASASTSHRPAPFPPAWRASTSTAFSSTPRPGSMEDYACNFRSQSAADLLLRLSSTYRETGAIVGTGSAFS